MADDIDVDGVKEVDDVDKTVFGVTDVDAELEAAFDDDPGFSVLNCN